MALNAKQDRCCVESAGNGRNSFGPKTLRPLTRSFLNRFLVCIN
jgi:hypothetical protein